MAARLNGAALAAHRAHGAHDRLDTSLDWPGIRGMAGTTRHPLGDAAPSLPFARGYHPVLGRVGETAQHYQGLQMMLGMLDAMAVAGVLLDRQTRVIGMTARAEEHFQSASSALRVSRGVLSGGDRAAAAMVDDMLADLLLRPDIRHRQMIIAGRADRNVDAPPPLPARFDIYRVEPQGVPPPSAPAFALVLRQKARGVDDGNDIATLRKVWGLTPAEAAVAILLHRGSSRDQIVAARGITRETLRAQLKTIYGKTGCNRETQLIQMLGAVLD